MDPGAQRVEHELAFAAFGDDDEQQRGIVGAQFAQARDAVHSRQLHVDGDHRGVRRARDGGQRMREIARLDEFADVELLGQQGREAGPAQWLVVGDNNALHVHGNTPSRARTL